MSETTLIQKVHINDVTGEGSEIIGKVNESDLAVALQAKLDSNKVKVSANDTTADYLLSKLTAGDGITLTETDDAGDESVTIANDRKLKVSANDTTAAYLEDKIEGSDYIQITTAYEAGNEKTHIELKFENLIGNHLGWVLDTIALASTRADETEFDAESIYIKPATGSQKNILFREDVSDLGAMGTLENIGSAQAMSASDWAAITGLQFVYTAEKNNWFNIKNNGTATNGNFKNIITGTGQDLKFLSRALFSYDHVIGSWLLIAYSRATFQRIDAIAGAANADIAVSSNLPQPGYYHFDAYVSVEELDTGVAANLDSQQVLTIKGSGDPTGDDIEDIIIVDTSNIYDSGVGGTTKTVGNSLQGSGIIYVTYDSSDGLIIYVNVTLPNGDAQSITGGYLHILYLGENIIDVA